MKKHCSIFFILCQLFFLVSCNNINLSPEEVNYLSKNKELTVATYINYPPYEFVNDRGEIGGILIDYFEVLEDKIGYKFKKKYYKNWQKLIKDAENGNVDITLEIQDTGERRDYLIFTDPIFKGKNVIVTNDNTNTNTYTNINQLVGQKVAVGNDYAIEEFLKYKHPEITLMPKANEAECIAALLNNEADAFIGLESITNYIIRKNGFNTIKIQEAQLPYMNELGIGINKQKPILASIINKGNKAITLKEKNDILNKWLYNFVTPLHQKASFWAALLGIAGMILLLSFLLNYYLKNKIKNRTEELVIAKLEAEKSNKLKTLFLQNISHEIRTPLNSIIGFTNFLKNNTIEEDDRQAYLDTILQESADLTHIIDDIIEISDLTTKKPEAKYEIFDLSKELMILSKQFKSKAFLENINFKFDNFIEASQSNVYTDKNKLFRSITNIVDNAFKFSTTGEVTLAASIQNDFLIFKVIDNGIGIPLKKHDAIFKEFYQVEKELSKKYKGLGIGLSIAKENITTLGGKIDVEPNTPKGSIFSITIPKLELPNQLKQNKQKELNSPMKILIAEDMKLNYLVLKKSLENIIKEEKTIIWAKNGQEAVNAFKETPFDLVLMDIKMPILDGYEATKQIKSFNKEIPVVAQTAYAQEDDMIKASEIGFDGYLTKPLNLEALKDILNGFFILKHQ